ncbi:MAG: phosphoenolpyruvate synthase [Desulfobulbaceae bacterium A2]|nr:MAG: phosphoenolpyruvate synthase [Desulfobulbaceae bacterium A2]
MTTPPLSFGTKAETLERIAGQLREGIVLPQLRFTVAQWRDAGNDIAAWEPLPGWAAGEVIVRSSALNEDCEHASAAGKYASVGNVRGLAAINRAVDEVVASMAQGSEDDQIFLQPMVRDARVSGVAFSRDPNNGGWYRVVNFDDQSSLTHTVTSGASNRLKCFYCTKAAHNRCEGWRHHLLCLLDELEGLFRRDALDVEFAVDGQNRLILLQVRPLILHQQPPCSPEQHVQILDNIKRTFTALSGPNPFLLGSKSVFGVMPDWNPAEIIGIRPRPLALSLYKELVTDHIWAYQRDNYGYRNLRSFPLMINFAGLPYIDVRVCFNSFIPRDVPEALAESLVNYYMQRLVEYPGLHDKVEFEIVFSCYTMDMMDRLAELTRHGFSQRDLAVFAESLRQLTNRIIHNEHGLWRQDKQKIHILKERRAALTHRPLDTISRIYWLLEDCKRYGTLPFAGLARAGFIAVQLLNSLVAVDVLSTKDYEHFLGSLATVGSSLTWDFSHLSRELFLQKYGHLRPGTYDILSPRYDEAADLYFDWSGDRGGPAPDTHPPFLLSLASMNRLRELLVGHKLDHDVLSLFTFIQEAIEGREWAKFEFTRNLSDAMVLMRQFGEELGFSADDLSYADVHAFVQLYASSTDPRQVLSEAIETGQRSRAMTTCLNLPPLITSVEHVDYFELLPGTPNFITQRSITAEVVGECDPAERLAGNIVMIPHADPGFDWIFTRGIGGFITMYGGVNSHMAIRAAELGIPAVIGAGEVLYQQWRRARRLTINCANKQVTILQ